MATHALALPDLSNTAGDGRSALSTAVIGTAAGLVAAAVMSAAQEAYLRLTGEEGGGDGENATTRTADMIARTVAGTPVPKRWRAASGEAVHYGLGAALGGFYALLLRRSPRAGAGFGAAYGIGAALVLDEAMVPAMGLGSSPRETPVSIHLYSLASHVVFGAALEMARRGLGGPRRDRIGSG